MTVAKDANRRIERATGFYHVALGFPIPAYLSRETEFMAVGMLAARIQVLCRLSRPDVDPQGLKGMSIALPF